MTLQLMDEMAEPELAVVGPGAAGTACLHGQCGGGLDAAADPANAEAFIKFVTSPEAKPIWHKGVELY